MSKRTYSQTADALGTTITISLVSDDIDTVEKVFKQLWSQVEKFENRFSRFIPESELSYFNVHAGEKVTVSAEFIDLLLSVKKISKLSKNLFNPFVLPGLQKAGYITSMKSYSQHFPALNFTTRRIVTVSKLTIGDGWAQIPSNTALDFGGIGKGYLADQLADVASEYTTDFYISLGGDISVSGKPAESKTWDIGVQSVMNTNIDIAQVNPRRSSYAVATSGLIRRADGQAQAHIIDPRTEQIAESEFSICTIVATSVTFADVLASCVLIGGETYAKTLLIAKVLNSVLLQRADGSIVKIGNDFSLSKDIGNHMKVTNA